MDARESILLDAFTQSLARRGAKKLIGRRGFTESDLEDLQQELLLSVLEQIPRFDPERCTIKAFVVRSINRRIIHLLRYHKRQCRDPSRIEASLDDPAVVLRETLPADGDGRRTALSSQDLSATADLASDLREQIGSLNCELRTVCKMLDGQTKRTIAAVLGMNPKTLNRRLDDLRHKLREQRN